MHLLKYRLGDDIVIDVQFPYCITMFQKYLTLSRALGEVGASAKAFD
jgi:hypothetical protein